MKLLSWLLTPSRGDFARYGYDDEGNVETTLRVLPTNWCFAGDYRLSGKLLTSDTVVMTSEFEPSFFCLVDEVV
jgi:hypothetical protein